MLHASLLVLEVVCKERARQAVGGKWRQRMRTTKDKEINNVT
jgi:hypothetical protein